MAQQIDDGVEWGFVRSTEVLAGVRKSFYSSLLAVPVTLPVSAFMSASSAGLSVNPTLSSASVGLFWTTTASVAGGLAGVRKVRRSYLEEQEMAA